VQLHNGNFHKARTILNIIHGTSCVTFSTKPGVALKESGTILAPVKLEACIRQMLGSNLDQNTGYPG
jgi:hypothetical protein